MMLSPIAAASRHSSGSSGLTAIQVRISSRYRSATTVLNSWAAAVASGVSGIAGHEVDIAVARHGFSRPWPPPASSTMPYLASWRRWNEQLPELSPSSCPARVAVSGPSRRSRPISRMRSGWAIARSARGSVSSMDSAGSVMMRT